MRFLISIVLMAVLGLLVARAGMDGATAAILGLGLLAFSGLLRPLFWLLAFLASL
jgi:hypothetical protein